MLKMLRPDLSASLIRRWERAAFPGEGFKGRWDSGRFKEEEYASAPYFSF